MRWEQVPRIALFENNTAAFIHDIALTSRTPLAANSPGTRSTLRMSRCRRRPDKIPSWI
jgi:hypothetical protein